ncbi:MAG: AAA family ATPase [Dehalococcoidia bacterium]
MKPVLLRIRGFTAFREEVSVEFEGRRLFVITGPTGAGKSSLLDAMTWALYGQVPRVGRSVKELVSQGERDMSVLFEFTVRDRGYRVARRYPGNTSTRLERLVNEQWVPVADRAADVTREVETILGMDYATFTRAIVLPQGEFDSFLRGEAKDRRSILSQLIGLGVYQRAGELARARATDHRTRAETLRTQLEKLSLATPERIAELRAREQSLAKDAEALAARRVGLVELRELATTDREHQQTLERAALAVREAEAELEEATNALAAATRAHTDRAAEVARIEAELAAVRYDATEHDRLKAAVALLDQRAQAEAALARAREELAGARTQLDHAAAAQRAAEVRARDATAALAAAQRAERAGETALAKAAGRAGRLQERLSADAATAEQAVAESDTAALTIAERIRALAALGQSLASAQGDRQRAHDALDRAQREQATHAAAAMKAVTAREEAERVAIEAREALDAARAADAAAHLRAALTVGDPCPVCGEPITRLGKHAAPNLARAESALERAGAKLAEARAAAEQAASGVAAAAARVEATDRQLTATEAHLAALHAEAAEHGVKPDGVARALDAAQAESERARQAAAEQRRAVATLREQALALRETLARVPATIEPTEAKRVTADPAVVRADLVEALAALDSAQRGSQDADRAVSVATNAAESAKRDHEVARRDTEKAEGAVAQAEQRLAGLGGVEGDPAQLRAGLARCEQQQQAQRDLVEALGSARAALAAAEAARDGAVGAKARVVALIERRRSECRTAEEEATAAHLALTASWRTTIGEGEPSLRALKAAMEAFEVDRERVQGDLTAARLAIEQATTQLDQAEQMRADAEEHQSHANLIGAVGTDLRGDRFIAYLLHESMQLLAADASNRLSDFTNGRYALVAEEDTFLVMDHLNGDELRSVKTLSGGETFLASLALALALSEHLPEISGTGGAVSLDSLFLDEGFGALDAEALDLAVQGLETLAEGSRMIGVISHVEELSERLPDRIRVEKGSHGSTVVTV